MGDSSTSPQRRRADDAQRNDTAADAGAVQSETPDAGPATSAYDLLRPLSSGSFPVPNSGSLAWLARHQSQQQITPPRISATREKSLQSDLSTGATVESFGRESPPRATASAGQQEANQSTPGSTSQMSADEDYGQPQHAISPSPYASIFSEGTDPTTPLVLRRCDEHDNTNDNPVRKYSESLQLFRRNEEDQDKTWKRRVVEYR
ncbi:hypothetical protein PISL3812_06682 [Talaromyces islandicus]|uniref:Uncharacterized protein n=1 Tax=Talaromyces islandicus TaxID=28573 RepID=A0A0U1M235_TALIS|nr:hypothetical protein PISL3812_06682 [Talaromyces islandicus]